MSTKKVDKKTLKKLYKKSPRAPPKKVVKVSHAPIAAAVLEPQCSDRPRPAQTPKVKPQGPGKKLADPVSLPLDKAKAKRKQPKRLGGHGYNKGWLAGWMAGWKEGTVNNQQ
jgi:hypothetical protein